MAAEQIPTISHRAEDGTLAELIYDPIGKTTALAVRGANQETQTVASLSRLNGETLTPYKAGNNLIATGCVRFPSALGQVRSTADLLSDIRAFLRRYVDLSPMFEEIAAHYVLLTWVYDAFNELGYLRFRGDYGTGKTRALMAVGSLCNKPFFASGASTVSPIFHVLDAFGGTLVLDEADLRFSDATADLTKILNNGNVRGLPVLRTMANRHKELSPTAFRVFGPKLIAMREGFDDPALESRFLTEETGGRPLRESVPLELPKTLESEATLLRNDLLAWRFANVDKIAIRPERAIAGIEPRFNQTALALLSLVDDDGIRARLATELTEHAARVVEDRAATDEAAVLRALVEAFTDGARTYVAVSEIAERFNRATLDRLRAPISNRRVGWLLRNKLRLSTTKTRGVYVVQQSEWARIATLASRYAVAIPNNGRG